MHYRLTDKGEFDARPAAYQNIDSWKRVKPILLREGIVSKARLTDACRYHDHSSGPAAFIKYIETLEWIERVA